MIHIAPTCRASGHTRFTGRWIATRALERPWHDDKTFTGMEIQKDSIPQSIVRTDRTLYFGTSLTWVYIRYGSCAGRSRGRLSSSFGLWGEKTLFVVGVFGLRRDCHRGNKYVQGKGKQVSMSSANSASDSQTNITQRVGVSDCGHETFVVHADLLCFLPHTVHLGATYALFRLRQKFRDTLAASAPWSDNFFFRLRCSPRFQLELSLHWIACGNLLPLLLQRLWNRCPFKPFSHCCHWFDILVERNKRICEWIDRLCVVDSVGHFAVQSMTSEPAAADYFTTGAFMQKKYGGPLNLRYSEGNISCRTLPIVEREAALGTQGHMRSPDIEYFTAERPDFSSQYHFKCWTLL